MMIEIKSSGSLLIFILLFITTNLSGQTNFLPGFVIPIEGDTLRGEIDFRNWDKSPDQIAFRKSSSAEIQKFTIANTRSFSVSNEFYESATVNIDTSTFNIPEMDDIATPKYKKQKVFLQYLIRGEKSLLLFKPDTERTLFFISIDQEFTPLVYKMYFMDPVNKKIAENKGYQKLLVLYLIECKSLATKIVNSPYEKKSLFRLFKTYYECTNKEFQHIDERKQSELSYGLIAGATVSDIKWYPTSPAFLIVDYDQSVNPTAGFFVDFKLLRSRRISINNDVLLTFFNIKYKGLYGNGLYEEVNSEFKYTYLKTNHMLRYNILHSGTLYAGIGLSAGLSLVSDTHIVTSYTNPGGGTEQSIRKTPLEFGWIGVVGTGLGRWRLEAKYESTSGLAYSSPTNTTRGYLVLKYRLGK